MRIFVGTIVSGILALGLAGCTTSIASKPGDIPGYRGSFGESVGEVFQDNDLNHDDFVRDMCKTSSGLSPYVLSIGDGSKDKPSNPGGGNNPGGNNNPGGGNPGGGGASHGMQADSSTISKYQASSQGSGGGGNGGNNGGNDPDTGGGKTTPSTGASFAVSLALDDKPTDYSPLRVSRCSLKVIAAAINLCTYRSLNRNAIDKLENYGIEEIIAVAGTAAAIATLAHSNGNDTTLITAGAAGAVGLFSNLQKAVPPPVTSQIGAIANAGLQYLAVDGDTFGDTSTHDLQAPDPKRLAALFDAAFSVCPVNNP